MMELFRPHSPKQEQALFSERPIILTSTGIQWGKTTVGAMKMKMWMHTYTDRDDNFIITAPTYKIMQQATLPAFLRAMEGFGTYHKGDSTFHVHGGGTAYLRTATDPDSIVGITNVRGIWGDEAGKYSLYFWENTQARASIKECQIILTTSPYTINWVYKELIKPWQQGHRHDELELVQARSDENPFFPRQEFERKRASMDPRRFNMVYGGEYNRMAGLVYDVFSTEQHLTKPRTLPEGTRYIAGVDWGYTSPAALVVLAVTPSNHYFVVDEHYETQLTIASLIEIARRKRNIFGIDRFYCDPSSPANIEEFNRAGLTALKADNEIRIGVDRCYELLKEGRLMFFEGRVKYLIDEIETYHYPDDPDIDGNTNVRELNPVKQDDHALDAMRYAVSATYHTGVKRHSPKVSPERVERRISRDPPAAIEDLKKFPTHPSYEEWS